MFILQRLPLPDLSGSNTKKLFFMCAFPYIGLRTEYKNLMHIIKNVVQNMYHMYKK